ncbi:MAG: putative bifunctional diguanylate cyclase/phosphodiesterase [Thermomicrobiales bacterium]
MISAHYGARAGWWLFVAGSAAAWLGYFLLSGVTRGLWLGAVGLAAVVAIVVGTQRYRPRRRVAWLLVAASLLLIAAGDLIAGVDEDFRAAARFPSIADGVSLAGRAVLPLALVLMIHRRSRYVDWSATIDAAIVAAAAALPAWVFLVQPATDDLDVTRVVRLSVLAFPLLDVLALAVVARLVFGTDKRIAAGGLLLVGLVALLAGDVAYLTLVLDGTFDTGHPMHAGWLLMYSACAAAGLHPSMRWLGAPVSDARSRFTARRLVAMAAASLLVPAVLALQWQRGERIDVPLFAASAAALSLLVIVRGHSLALEHADRGEDAQRWRGEQRFRALVRHAADLVAILDGEGVFQFASPAVEQMLGRRSNDLIGLRFSDLVEPDEGARLWWFFAELVGVPGRHATTTLRLRHKDGDVRVLELSATNLLATPEVGGVVINARDISERERTVMRPSQTASKYQTLIEQIPVITYIGALDPRNVRDWTLLHVSPQVETLLGYSVDEYVGGPRLWRQSIHPDDRERVTADEARTARTGEPIRVEYRVLASDGRVVWVRDEAVLIGDEAGEPIYWHGVIFDITERKRFEDALTHQAFHDPLTGLPNRALFLDRLTHAFEASRRRNRALAVLFMDLNGFKLINDSLGHDAGDRALVLVARRLEQCRRPGDTLARFGGDEFALLLEEIADARGALTVTERIAETLREPLAIEGQEVVISVSVGIAVSVADHEDPGDILREADAAMYEAKRTQAGCAIFDDRMTEHARTRLQLEADLRRAVAGDELRLAYQPVVELATGRIVEIEALVRWAHPEHGTLLPPVFVPLAEETGLIEPMGRWVLETACRQAMTWQGDDLGDPPVVAVNLSARQLGRPALIEDVTQALEASNLDPRRLKLEVTESTAMAEEGAITMMRALKALGVQLALDDFGTGYSGLSVLKRFPLDDLKLDRTFVAGIGRDAGDTAIVAAVVAFAQALELRVTAEGIETAAQVTAVRELGCERAQGFYFARPLTGEALTALLDRGLAMTDLASARLLS